MENLHDENEDLRQSRIEDKKPAFLGKLSSPFAATVIWSSFLLRFDERQSDGYRDSFVTLEITTAYVDSREFALFLIPTLS